MSFRSMLESGECGQTNPMIDLARQLTCQSASSATNIDNTLSDVTLMMNNDILTFDQVNSNTMTSAVESLMNTNEAETDQLDASKAFNMESLLEEMNLMESKFMTNTSNNLNNDELQSSNSIHSAMKSENDPLWNNVFDNDQLDEQQSNENKLPELNVDWADEYLRKLELNDDNNESKTIKEVSNNCDNNLNGSWDLNEKQHQIQTDQPQSMDYRNQTVDNVNQFFANQSSFTPFLRPIVSENFGRQHLSAAIDDANLNDLVSDQEKRLISMLLGNNKNGNEPTNAASGTSIAPIMIDKNEMKTMKSENEKISTDNKQESIDKSEQQTKSSSPKSIVDDEQKNKNENFFYENQFDDMEFWMKLAEEWHSSDITGGDMLADVDTSIVQIREPLENLLKIEHPYYYKMVDNNPFIVKDYTKQEKNEMINYLEQGQQRMNVGDLSAAVLLFEAAVQQEPNSIDAWRLLGIANAKNENDHKSISAFKRCLALQPKDESIVLECLMYLATSFTNESLTTEACNALQEWLNCNSKYRELMKETDEPYLGPTPLSKRWIQKKALVGNPFSNGLFDSVRENFVNVVKFLEENQQSDADVQCGLGVLYNLSGEYEKAIDCFAAALESRPDDYALWNRYGASLANGGRAEDSMSAYREALIRYPGYIRARYNLAISCVMMGLGEEAAEHLLSVLKLQLAGADSVKDMVDLNRDNITSTSVWSLLRSAMSMHGRIDLLDLVDKRDLDQLIIEFYKAKSNDNDTDENKLDTQDDIAIVDDEQNQSNKNID